MYLFICQLCLLKSAHTHQSFDLGKMKGITVLGVVSTSHVVLLLNNCTSLSLLILLRVG